MMELSSEQRTFVNLPIGQKIFLEGAAGTGKTTAGYSRLLHLLAQGIPAHELLVIVPQQPLAAPYLTAVDDHNVSAGGRVRAVTLAALAQEAITLFYPLVMARYGVETAELAPSFLSLETAQYYMARVLDDVIETQNMFESVTLDRPRLYSQILDNLNKAAVVGFPITEIAGRLKASAVGDDTQRRIYDDVQTCALLFREFCLKHHLMDFSLQIEVFTRHLWQEGVCRDYFTRQYRHLIVDNIEEESPATHDLLRDWLPQCESALVIYDDDGGFRRFLGADERNAYALRDVCDSHITFTDSWVSPPALIALGQQLAVSLGRVTDEVTIDTDFHNAVIFEDVRYYTEMIDVTAQHVAQLVHEHGVPPREIVIAAPYVSDALQFSLVNRLSAQNIPVRTHRPSRALRQESAALCLLSLAQIAHPNWQLAPPDFDIIQVMALCIDGLDPVRAQLLVNYAYRQGEGRLLPFDQLPSEVRDRVTYVLGERYERLRVWIEAYRNGEPMLLDHFWSHLFGEVLSQVGFGFHSDFKASEVCSNLIDSARRFRQIVGVQNADLFDLGREYVTIVNRGLLADQYLRSWDFDQQDAVLITPAYSFLVRNVAVGYQFWLNISAPGWSERLYQPLTHPYVLARDWPRGRVWTDADEVEVAQQALYRVAVGMLRRCRTAVYMMYSVLGEQGTEQRGLLLTTMQDVLRRQAGGERV